MLFIVSGLAFSLGINVVMFVPAYIYKTDKLTDISYSLTFIFLALFGFILSNSQSLHKLLLVMICIWALRLGGFLFIRIQKIGRDKRFDGRRELFGRFLGFWLLQGLTVGVVMTSSMLAFSNPNPRPFNVLTGLGIVIFALGLIAESVADIQKYQFSQSPNNKNQWIDKGIWRISRHPNYLGEMMVWVGVYLTTFVALSGLDRWFGLISPLFIISLLLFVSGIPLLEKSADAKWGSDNKYKEYKKKVPVLIPTPSSIARLKN